MLFKNLSIKSRLIFVVSFLCLMCISGAFIGLTSLYAANEALKDNYEDRLVPTGQLDRIVRLIQQNQIAVAEATSDDSAGIAKEMDAVDARVQEIDKLWQAYVHGNITPREKELADLFVAARARFVSEGLKPAETALRAGDIPKATATMRGPMHQHAAEINKATNNLLQFQLDAAKHEFDATQERYLLVRNACLSGMLVSILIAAAICLWLMHSIARPLSQAVKIARSVAAGDLSNRIEVDSADETGQLLQALKEMNESLVRIVSEVRTGTETIATASSQIASGNMDLSARTETQASSLEETASSMEELTSTVKQNADSAFQANQLAMSASEVAVRGGSVVSEVVHTMGSINNSAKKIVDIIDVIDSIAFQTNILALNAAVEAARAGEQGKGFAVVATEVRQLAQRSAAAAKQIKELIDDSVEKIDTGARLVDEAGSTMQEIVASVKRVTDIMQEISVASKEQTQGIEQVNLAINQMDEVTQQNAALVEEAAAAAASMQEQAMGLSHVVSIFKLGAGASVRVPAPAGEVMVAAPAAASRAVVPAGRQVARGNAMAGEEWTEF
ncbi:methyl-accepting chemotaxis protein [Noviherbaspirillum galbum]|uniref:HAMP domain-containing protein n=1 Tax=Noviherbaspirillum galbum TaxID=2709383 RepID=A0A6B3SMC0_9BURK|nr:methyl-accepting chemotaxis protein [Noviherbaspirillum galbum]NEX60475.1 HAMP domain-containing protein [Noviherbaspirillum galbum]